jgi:hypothetical protein
MKNARFLRPGKVNKIFLKSKRDFYKMRND